ncbi:helix-turn-helix domain-containing protein [Methylobacillus glycogenes]|uniref:helix-turn-helix domain-containing protein n=1 Tax=Methylobacillus glycogenes TaxID=406 RepID=UPI000472F25A|nr:helix-turn-helix transcriptional regulator [Methylobacillus glycogenes]
MTLQTIKSLDGKDEYVLLPIAIYEALKDKIQDQLAAKHAPANDDDEFIPFVLEDYIDNPLALARIKAGFTQQELAAKLNVTQAYISKVERQDKVTAKLLERVHAALAK